MVIISIPMDFQQKLTNYAALIVRHGMNVQPGQLVNIDCEIAHRELAFAVASEAYRVGAKSVTIEHVEPRLMRVRLDVSDIESLGYVPAYITPKYNELLQEGGANLKIVGPEAPDILSGVAPAKVNALRKSRHMAVKEFFDKGIGQSKVSWCVAAAATPQWGVKVFPDLRPEDAHKRLWEEIFRCCRVDLPDFMAQWKRHNDRLHGRARLLTSLDISTLHFSGPGTDLTVGLSDRARFVGGTEAGPREMHFEPNLPTEEVFTTPDYRVTSGHVRVTRPVMMNGVMLRGLNIIFKDGRIIDFTAEQGADTFREYISSDEGGARLGEVALVGIDSPIFRSGLVYEEILFDENAACHIAVGAAYRFCIKDGAAMTSEQLASIGFNESTVHCDMMISSEEVDVTAKLRDGRSIPIIVKGVWQSPFFEGVK